MLRDQRTRVVNIELINLDNAAVTTNFVMPDEIVSIVKRFGAVYNKKKKEWVIMVSRYKELAFDIVNFCVPRKIDVDLIP